MYLEMIFIENFIVSFILIKILNYLINTKKDNKKIVISIIIQSLYNLIITITNINIVCKIVSGICIFLITTFIIIEPRSLRKYIKYTIFYFLENMMLVGIVYINLLWIDFKIINYIISFLILFYLNYSLKIHKRRKIEEEFLEYNIEFKVNNKFFSYKAMVDTGNTSKIDKHSGIIFLKNKENVLVELENSSSKKSSINVKTINSTSNQKVYFLNNICVKKGTKEITNISNAPIVILEKKDNFNKKYESIIDFNTYLDKIGGCLYD